MDKIISKIRRIFSNSRNNVLSFENPNFFLMKAGQETMLKENPLLSIEIDEITRFSKFERIVKFNDKTKDKIEEIPKVKREYFKEKFNAELHDGSDEAGCFREIEIPMDVSELSDRDLKRMSNLGITDFKKPNYTASPITSAMNPNKRFNCNKDRYAKVDSRTNVPQYVLDGQDAARGDVKPDLLRKAASNKITNGTTEFKKTEFRSLSTGKKRILNLVEINEKYNAMSL